MTVIGPDTRLKRTANQASCVVDNDTMVMYLPTGRYFSIDLVGSEIWGLLEKAQTPHSLVETLCHDYDTTPENCLRDTLVFLAQLLQWGLIEPVP